MNDMCHIEQYIGLINFFFFSFLIVTFIFEIGTLGWTTPAISEGEPEAYSPIVIQCRRLRDLQWRKNDLSHNWLHLSAMKVHFFRFMHIFLFILFFIYFCCKKFFFFKNKNINITKIMILKKMVLKNNFKKGFKKNDYKKMT